MLQLLTIDDTAVPNFYNFVICKAHSTNLEHCFTVSMTAHSISI